MGGGTCFFNLLLRHWYVSTNVNVYKFYFILILIFELRRGNVKFTIIYVAIWWAIKFISVVPKVYTIDRVSKNMFAIDFINFDCFIIPRHLFALIIYGYTTLTCCVSTVPTIAPSETVDVPPDFSPGAAIGNDASATTELFVDRPTL